MRKFVVNTYNRIARIDPNIYGNFSEHLGRCIYGGIYVGEDSPIPNVNGMRTDLVEAFRKIRLPLLRWPGGCFADTYHWKDGVGPREERKTIVNTNWGGVTEDNSFGTHEFMEFCRQVGCEPYVCGNVGSGTVQEMSDWVEYMNFDGVSPMADERAKNGRKEPFGVRYFAVGNENWGCGGLMTPERYASEFRRYSVFCKSYPGAPLCKVACGPNSDDAAWTEVLMREAAPFMDALALHYYTLGPGGWDRRGSATVFTPEEWYGILRSALKMEDRIRLHSAVMDRYDPEKRVALFVDEWGTWYDVEPGTNPGFLYQQNTVRDALAAGLTLNIFNAHADRVRGANIAQLVNVLQSLALTDGPDMCLTPTYHVFDLYKHHQGADLLESFIQTEECGGETGHAVPDLSQSVSMDADGVVHVTLCNLSLDREIPVEGILVGAAPQTVTGEIVTGEMDAHNTFEAPDTVAARPFDGAGITHGGFTAVLPPRSVVHLALR